MRNQLPTAKPASDSDPLLKPEEVTTRLRISPRTLARWAGADPPLIASIQLPGGHRRYRSSVIDAILEQQEPPANR